MSSAKDIKEFEDLLQAHALASRNLFNKLQNIVITAEKNNDKVVTVPLDVLKLLLLDKSLSNDSNVTNSGGGGGGGGGGIFKKANAQMGIINGGANNTSSSTTTTMMMITTSPSTPTTAIEVSGENNNSSSGNGGGGSSSSSSSSKSRRTLFTSKLRGKKDTTKRFDVEEFQSSPSPSTPIDRSIHRNIRARLSLRSPAVIKALGEAPKFILHEEIDRLPKMRLQKLTVNKLLTNIKAPGESSQKYMSFGNYACAISFSNYPKLIGRPYGEGDPICDRLQISLFENRVIMSLADGCNWGDQARKAARRATKHFNQFLISNSKDLLTIRSTSSAIMAAFAEADKSIREDMNELGPPPGSTTLIGGILAEIDFTTIDPKLSPRSVLSSTLRGGWNGQPWVFIFGSVGDCKCYHFCTSTRKLTDYTRRARTDPFNATNPGGRLGGAHQADLENFLIDYIPCDQDDLILFMTDGIYDNFDPIQQGKTPKDIGYPQYNDWKEIEKVTLHSIIDNYVTEFIEKQLIPDQPLLRDILANCANFVVDFTSSSRQFMQQNPKSKLPNNLSLYPGKLDHSSATIIKVGKIALSYDEWVTSSSPSSSPSPSPSPSSSSSPSLSNTTSSTDHHAPKLTRSQRTTFRSNNNNNNNSLSSHDDDDDSFTDSDDPELLHSYSSIRRHTKLFE